MMPQKRYANYKQWVSDANLILVEDWARNGLTDEGIARKMGIALSTLYKWKKEHSEFSDAIKRGKEVVDALVEAALFNNALAGNVTAQIFWLKNRRRNRWSEKADARTDKDIANNARKWIEATGIDKRIDGLLDDIIERDSV